MKTAVIIVGHGSRSQSADEILKPIAAAVKRNGGFAIAEYAYLQHVQPGIEEALTQCIRKGAEKIVVVPFFMHPGSHVTRDIPHLIEKTRKQYPAVEIRLTKYVGSHPAMTDIVLDLADKVD